MLHGDSTWESQLEFCEFLGKVAGSERFGCTLRAPFTRSNERMGWSSAALCQLIFLRSQSSRLEMPCPGASAASCAETNQNSRAERRAGNQRGIMAEMKGLDS